MRSRSPTSALRFFSSLLLSPLFSSLGLAFYSPLYFCFRTASVFFCWGICHLLPDYWFCMAVAWLWKAWQSLSVAKTNLQGNPFLWPHGYCSRNKKNMMDAASNSSIPFHVFSGISTIKSLPPWLISQAQRAWFLFDLHHVSMYVQCIEGRILPMATIFIHIM